MTNFVLFLMNNLKNIKLKSGNFQKLTENKQNTF